MDDKLLFLQTFGYDIEEIYEMDEVTFINKENQKFLIFDKVEFADYCKVFIKHEIAFVNNNFLRDFLPSNKQSDIFIDELKELSKFDCEVLLCLITVDRSFFFIKLMNFLEINIEDLLFDDSKFLQTHHHPNLFGIIEKEGLN